MIVLLSYSKNLLANINDTVPLRGSECEDSALVLVPIKNIKIANIKLTERKYLIKELFVKDSILNLKDYYIQIQESEIDNYKKYIQNLESLNNNLNTKVDNYKRNFTIYGSITISVVSLTVLYLLLK